MVKKVLTEFDVKDVMGSGPDVNLGNVPMVSEEDGKDIGDAVNTKLSEIGADHTLFIEPKQYTKANNIPLETPIQSQTRDQVIIPLGADMELADGVDEDPIQINHNGFKINHLNIDANESNNSNNAAIIATDVSGLQFIDVEPGNASIGVDLDGVTSTIWRASKIEAGLNVSDTGMRMTDCDSIVIQGAGVEEYQSIGIELASSDDIILSSIFINTPSDANADSAIRIAGSQTCELNNIIIEGNGGVSEGITNEVFDPGRSNERQSDGNAIGANVKGVSDIAFHISGADVESIRGTVNGDMPDGGRTTQGFLVDDPNNIDDTPGHDIDIDIKNTSRVTDTEISSSNAGLSLSGHISKIQNTSTVQAAGSSVIDFTFGPANPNPIFNIITNTIVETQLEARRNTTDSNGEISIDWSNTYAFDDKPILNIQLENAGSWHIQSFTTDGNNRNTGATVQVIDPDGSDAGNNEDVLAVLQGT